MITLQNKFDCCGCEACVQICPKQCISMEMDDEGFYYPVVNKESCIDCNRCNAVCPVINRYDNRKPIKALAAKNYIEDIKLKSSSGGVFDALAKKVLDDGGVVFGVEIDAKQTVRYTYVEEYDSFGVLRGSKYVQAIVGDSYKEVRDYLKEPRLVLFSGTPCQIAALKHFLKKNYENLVTVEVLCHGVPSPGIWKNYIDSVKEQSARSAAAGKNMVLSSSLKDMPVITGVNFREKINYGWEKFGFVVRGKSASKADKNLVLLSDTCQDNPFMKGFLADLYLRPSCHLCPARNLNSGADITIGDYWGVRNIHKDFYSADGVSLVLLNTKLGINYWKEVEGLISIPTDFNKAIKYNPIIAASVKESSKRKLFFEAYIKAPENFNDIVNKLAKRCLYRRILSKVKQIILG